MARGAAARRGLHLLARPRHRLGRRRPGRPGRRAQGRRRLLQRIGRANHRLDEPSRAVLVPANRFEVLECLAAPRRSTRARWTATRRAPAGSTCWPSTSSAWPAPRPSTPTSSIAEVTRAAPYADLTREDFDDALRLRRDRRLRAAAATTASAAGPAEATASGACADPALARQYRMNVGTIVEAPMMQVRLAPAAAGRWARSRSISSDRWSPGDTFLFAGQLLRFEASATTEVDRRARAARRDPKVPAYAGGKLPLTTHLADARAPACWPTPPAGARCRTQVREWLRLQRRALGPARPRRAAGRDLPARRRHFMVAYCFAGRNAHQTLGMLLTRRMERAGCGRWASSPPTTASRLEPPTRSPTSTACSIRTCWATTSRTGWPKSACCAGPSATARWSPA